MCSYSGLSSSLGGSSGQLFFTANLLECWRGIWVRYVDRLFETVRKTHRDRLFYRNAWMVVPNRMCCISNNNHIGVIKML